MATNKPKVFISFDFDNDQFLRDSLIGQCKHDDTPFDMEDWSVKEPWNQDEWKERCLTKIKRCDLVIVMVGEKTANCSGVKAENEAPRPRGAGDQFSITTVIGDCYGVLYTHFLGFLHS